MNALMQWAQDTQELPELVTLVVFLFQTKTTYLRPVGTFNLFKDEEIKLKELISF